MWLDIANAIFAVGYQTKAFEYGPNVFKVYAWLLVVKSLQWALYASEWTCELSLDLDLNLERCHTNLGISQDLAVDSGLPIVCDWQHVKNIMLDVKTSLEEMFVFISVEAFILRLMASVRLQQHKN